MIDGEFWELGHVDDRELQRALLQLLASGSRTEARIIAHLAAVEERRLHLEAGSSSLFGYCCARLGLSENEAFHRITAARLARRFPLIFGLIERREIHLTAVCLLRDYLTPENHRELLAEASGKRKVQVLELLARRFPRPDVASTIRKLPAPRPAGAQREVSREGYPQPAGAPEAELCALPVAHAPARSACDALASSADSSQPTENARTENEQVTLSAVGPSGGAVGRVVREQVVEPLSAERYRIQLNASVQLKEKLARAVDLLSHANPTGDLAVVIERALDLLIDQVQKQRFAQTKRPRRRHPRRKHPVEAENGALSTDARPQSRRRHIPNEIKRQITARDGVRCTFVGADGTRCDATKFAQIHHEEPWARGGGDTADNLRILCAAHNRLLGEQDFGRQFVARQVEARRAQLQGSTYDERTAREQERPGKA
jgi:hypothetical protein